MSEDWRPKPFAIQLLEEQQGGKSVEQISRDTGIPVERVEMRLKAARAYLLRVLGMSGSDPEVVD